MNISPIINPAGHRYWYSPSAPFDKSTQPTQPTQSTQPNKIITTIMGLFYSTSDLWADIIPIAQDDGGPNPLAAIAYTGEYSEAMSYLRAVMAREEKSPRVLLLTEDIIGMNPAHYTVW